MKRLRGRSPGAPKISTQCFPPFPWVSVLNGPAGLTFLEIIFALSLFLVGLLAVTAMFGISDRAVHWGGAHTQAVLAAREQLEFIKGMPYGQMPGQSGSLAWQDSGDFQRLPIELTWRVEKDRPFPGLSLITIQAEWHSAGNRSGRFELATLRANSPTEPSN